MSVKTHTELLEMHNAKKPEYLQRYYDVCKDFFGAADTAVTEEEIDRCVRSFREKPSPVVRRQIKLKDWKFRLDENGDGLREGFYSREHDESGWQGVTTPYACQHVPENPVRFGTSDYLTLISEPGQHFTIWRGDYDTWFKARAGGLSVGDGDVAYLSFESVNLKSDVWVNEFPVMIDHLGLFPFTVEITEQLRKTKGGEAVIAVRASNTASTMPQLMYSGIEFAYSGKQFSEGRSDLDWADKIWTGIAGDVTLTLTNKNHIQDAFIHTTDIRGRDASVSCSVRLRNASQSRFRGTLKVEVSKWLPAEGAAVRAGEEKVCVLPLNESTVCVDFRMKGADLWSVDSPNLYLAHIVLEDADGRAIDDLYETFGVRTIRLQGSHFYLNNEKIVPRGTHDACHYHGEPSVCPSDRAIARDLLMHKKMGAICSRWPSDIRMHYKRIAEYCDQFGYLLSWAGYLEIWTIHPEAEMYAQRDVKAMIRSLRNCPSIIVWEMGDEVLLGVQDMRRVAWYERMYDLVREEDSSRPIIPSGGYCNELVDQIHARGKDAPDYTQARQSVLADYPAFDRELEVWDYHYCPCLLPISPYRPVLDKVRDTLGGQKPVIFTEFGCDGLPEPSRVEELYGKFRWSSSPFIASSRSKIDRGCYGEEITAAHWQKTQAFQAAVIGGMIDYLRQHPDDFAGYYFVCMFDVWTFYWGAADAGGKCKLLYYVARNCLQNVYVSGLHGNTVLTGESGINITVSNYAQDIRGARLRLTIRNGSGETAAEAEFSGIVAKGDVAVSRVVDYRIPALPEGLYSIEYYLYGAGGELICKNVEVFYLTN